MKRNTRLHLSRLTIRVLESGKLRRPVGGISGAFGKTSADHDCQLSGLQFGCESGPETDTGQYGPIGQSAQCGDSVGKHMCTWDPPPSNLPGC